MKALFPLIKSETDVVNRNVIYLLQIIFDVVLIHLHVAFEENLILGHTDLKRGPRGA